MTDQTSTPPGDAPEPLVDTARLTRIATVLIWTWLATDVALGLSALYTTGVLGGFGGAIAPAESFEGLEHVLAATGVLMSWRSPPPALLCCAGSIAPAATRTRSIRR